MVIHRLLGTSEFSLIFKIPPESASDARGEVAIQLGTGEPLLFALDRRYFRVLRILIEAAVHDRGLDLEWKGVRDRQAIARAYAAQANQISLVELDVITRYVMHIRKAVNQAIAELVSKARIPPPIPPPDVIRTVPGRGYCMGDLSVIAFDHTVAEA